MRLIINIFVSCVIFSILIYSFEDPFINLYSNHGFDVKFIYYSEGTGTKNNGVVVLLINRNKYKIAYSFELIFRTPEKDKSVLVKGTLKPG